ncbi:hypothetical protein O6H91_14G024600 [Diphasiastrum complanatum]|nr:hypothetical protein O6H91_14G024600 [Diphasiastrum complanatum]
MDGRTGLSWILHGDHLFVWSHISSAPQNCAILNIPPHLCLIDEHNIDATHGDSWLVCIVSHQTKSHNQIDLVKGQSCAGLVMCSRKSLAVLYWPDIFSDEPRKSVVSLVLDDKLNGSAPNFGLNDDRLSGSSTRRSMPSSGGVNASTSRLVSSLVAAAVPGTTSKSCVAIASCSNGDLWRFDCSPSCISHQRINREVGSAKVRNDHSFGIFALNGFSPGSLVWRSGVGFPEEGWQQFLLLTAWGLECWDVELTGKTVAMAWLYDISQDADIQRDLAGQKEVWLLDVQVDETGKVFTVLAASFSKDRVNSLSYMQYSLLTFLHTPHSKRFEGEKQGKFVEKKAPIQVILPKARVEEEEFLYSMRLRVGGRPSGSAMVLAGDGTATIAHYWNGIGRLYQFDLAWDAGRVFDASVVPSLEDTDEGAWLVLTEKAGVWAIPEKAVLLGAVEPPERSLSRRMSSSEDSSKEQRRKLLFGNSSSLRQGRPATDSMEENRQEVPTKTISQRPLQDDEAEATVGRLFHQYVLSGKIDGVLEKLQQAGAFEQEGEMNVFARASKAIVDTLAKHWAMAGGGVTTMLAAISSQLAEKKRRHQQYLDFLAASKCHVELKKKQRSTLHAIMEHREKLIVMIELRDLHNARDRVQQQDRHSTYSIEKIDNPDGGGALWDTVQLVGERSRRKNVMLMDREKTEVFYTRVSDVEDFFNCIQHHGSAIIGQEEPIRSQIERLCELSKACISSLRAAIQSRDSQQVWYPSPEGLTPWYCKPTVRSGVWKVATLLMEMRAEAAIFEPLIKEQLVDQLEEVADILLEEYAGAITAKVEREEEYWGLQMEYWSKRDKVLSALQQHATEIAEAAIQNAADSEYAAQQRLEILRNRYGSVLALARHHAGYQTLWDICVQLNDMSCLRSLMHESMGLKEGRFSNFVFEQCLKNGQLAKLLRLGEEFPEELQLFLRDHKGLLWLHEFYLQQFTSASKTLHALALSSEEGSEIGHNEEPLHSNCKNVKTKLKLFDRRRLLYLAKLSVLAGGELGAKQKAAQIDADLGILAIQEMAVKMGVVDNVVLSPMELIELLLKSEDRELVVAAFKVFALAGDLFRRGNKSLLEAAWLKVADQDNWIKMRQTSEEEGWSDEHMLQALRTTALFEVSRRCYSEGAYIYGSPFEEVLPLMHTDKMQNEGKERGLFRTEIGTMGSVEEVLMQHKDFPEAGEAMLTALRMGKSVDLYLEEREQDDMSEN